MELDEIKNAVKASVTEAVNVAVKEAVDPLKAELDELKKRPVTDNAKGLAGATPDTPPAVVGRAAKFAKARREAFSAADPHKGKGLKFAAAVRAVAIGKQLGVPAYVAAEKVLGQADIAEEMKATGEMQQKAMVEGLLEDGGSLVPPDYVLEVIELLTAVAVIRALGPTTLDMPRGTLSFPKETADAQAFYIGEARNIPTSQVKTGLLNFAAKKLAAIVPISNDLLRDAGPSADALVRNRIVKRMGLREDQAFLRGPGSEHSPKGLRHLAASGNVFDATQAGATATLAEVVADGWKLIGKLQDKNVQVNERCAFVAAPRILRFLAQLRDGVGSFVFKDEIMAGRFLGHRIASTTQIPVNLGAGSNESELYFAQFDEVLLADSLAMEVSFGQDAAYHDGSTVQSGFSTDVSAIRAISRHDFGVAHEEAVAVLTGVKWGA